MEASVVTGPALVFGFGGRFDPSFNEAAYIGAERWATTTGDTYEYFEPMIDAQRKPALQAFAERGHEPVVAIGQAFAASLSEASTATPGTFFAIIDAIVDQPNVG